MKLDTHLEAQSKKMISNKSLKRKNTKMSSKSKKKCLKQIDHFSAHQIKLRLWMMKRTISAGMSTLRLILNKVEIALSCKRTRTLKGQEGAISKSIKLVQLPI